MERIVYKWEGENAPVRMGGIVKVYQITYDNGNEGDCYLLVREHEDGPDIHVWTNDTLLLSLVQTAMIMSRQFYISYKLEDDGEMPRLYRVDLDFR